MKKPTRILALAACLSGLLGLGCPSSTSNVKEPTKKDQNKGANLLLPKSTKKVLKKRYYSKLPPNIQTVKLKKGIPLYLFLHPKHILSTKPFPSKAWVNQAVPKRRHRSWYIRLKPDKGVKLGRFTFVRVIMAVWHAAGGFRSTSRMSIQFLLRRGTKEKLLFSTMQLPKGQNYQAYDVNNREINYDSEDERMVKDGDILVFRVRHRSGNGGTVALGGGTGPRGSFFVIATHRIGNYRVFKK